MFHEHVREFDGRPVVDFEAGQSLTDVESSAYRIGLDYESEDTVVTRLSALLSDPLADRLESLVIGPWFTDDPYGGDAGQVVETLVAASSQLANLKSLFFGDIIVEECEVSWIQQSDVTPLLNAYPRLETFQVRGSDGLALNSVQHDSLQSFTVECGGLPKEMLQSLSKSNLPALESLQLYLGTDNYGWDGSIEDVNSLLASSFPRLTHLGLVDSEEQDAVTQAILASPIMKQLKSLDLSQGTLTDEGGKALLESEEVKSLEQLIIRYHFLSDNVVGQLNELPIKTAIDRAHAEEHEYNGEISRYVAVGE